MLNLWRSVALAVAICLAGPQLTLGCTVFVLTDGNRTLFFNNEDWSNPRTRLWFSPPGEGHFGCAFVGFDDGFAQGGLNTEGLAFDAVASLNPNDYQPDPSLLSTRGSSAERMLESCATVEEAIAFYQKHREPDFARARLMVADKTGASAIIGAREGELYFERSRESRGFGYGEETLRKRLSREPKATVADGVSILRSCAQKGQYATKYLNAFDLVAGDIYLYLPSSRQPLAKLNLAEALRRGATWYDIPEIRAQWKNPPRPLPNELTRFFLDQFPATPDVEPEFTRRARAIVGDWTRGIVRKEEFTEQFGAELLRNAKETSRDLERFGALVSATRVAKGAGEPGQVCHLRMNFEKAAVLMEFEMNGDRKVANIRTLGVEWAPPEFFRD